MTNYIAVDYITWDYTKYICASSLLLCIPCLYAFSVGLYTYAFLICIALICSINYWRKATYGIRRDLDRTYARLLGLLFLYKGIHYIHHFQYFRSVIYCFIVTCTIVYCFYKSNKHIKEQYLHSCWYKYHICFHILIAYMMCIVLYLMSLVP